MIADNKDDGNNNGPQQGGGNPIAGNPSANSTSTPANKVVKRGTISSASKPTRLAINETEVQDRLSGTSQNRFVERTHIQEQRQDNDSIYSEVDEVSDRGQDYEENTRYQRRGGNQRQAPRESKYQSNAQGLYTQERYQQDIFDRMSSEIEHLRLANMELSTRLSQQDEMIQDQSSSGWKQVRNQNNLRSAGHRLIKWS